VYYASLQREGPVEVVIADGSGAEQRRATLPDTPVRAPMSVGGRAVFMLDGPTWYVVSPSNGSVQSVSFPATAPERLAIRPEFTPDRLQAVHWIAVDDQRGALFLVDVHSGKVIDAGTLTGGARVTTRVFIAPDQRNVLFTTDRGTWLMSLEADAQPRQLASDPSSVAAGFTADGERVVYLQPGELVSERLDGSDRREQQLAQGALQPILIPERNVVVLSNMREQQVVTMRLDGGAPQGIDVALEPVQVLGGASPKGVIVGSQKRDWAYVDLDRGVSRPLSELQGLSPVALPAELVYFGPPQQGRSGPRAYRSVDLGSGQIRDLAALDDGAAALGFPRLAPDMRHGLVVTQRERNFRIFAFVGDTGSSRELSNGPDLGGMDIDSAGRVVRGDRTGQLQLIVGSDQPRAIGTGYQPAWIHQLVSEAGAIEREGRIEIGDRHR
jgi:hypothetical protein